MQLSFGIFTERWNRGFELSPDAIRRIEALGAGVDFDIYANLEEADGYHGVAADDHPSSLRSGGCSQLNARSLDRGLLERALVEGWAAGGRVVAATTVEADG